MFGAPRENSVVTALTLFEEDMRVRVNDSQTDLWGHRKVGDVVVPFAQRSGGTLIRTDRVSFEPAGNFRF